MIFEQADIPVIGVLIFLEGVLSIDNSVVLALLAGKLPKSQQKQALTYGLVGAIIFRLVALSMANSLMKWVWVKFLGGGYLLYLGVDHFFISGLKKNESEAAPNAPERVSRNQFWKAVLLIELTDMAFAVDSILAAVAISNKLPVVIVGGIIGLILMRFAATFFIVLLEKFPRLETSAYLLILLIGAKLFIQGFQFDSIHFEDSHNPAFFAFWSLLAVCLAFGFFKPSKDQKSGSKSSKGS